MYKSLQLRLFLFSLLPFFLFSCSSSSYQVVKSSRGEYAITKDIPADSAVIRKYMPYKLKLDSQMNGIIGYSDVALTKKSQDGESLLGNFLSDAALAEARKIDPRIDFTMPSTNGGLRNDLPYGAIKLSNVFELMPFENELITFNIKGTDVQSLLDFIAHSGGQPVGGITMKIVNGKAADVMIGGRAFDPANNYYVLTSDYISGGGDGVSCFKNPVSHKVLGLKIRDALIQYIKGKQAKGEKISSKTDRRITHD